MQAKCGTPFLAATREVHFHKATLNKLIYPHDSTGQFRMHHLQILVVFFENSNFTLRYVNFTTWAILFHMPRANGHFDLDPSGNISII